MDVRHGVINVGGLGAMPGIEINRETVHHVWQIFLIAKVFTFTVEQVFSGPGLRVTVGAAALEFQLFVESELSRGPRGDPSLPIEAVM